jgi:hypothetical protein
MTTPQIKSIESSFRDPASGVFLLDGVVHRHVRAAGVAHLDALHSSGLYDNLTAAGVLVPHEDVTASHAHMAAGGRILKPAHVPFISYPFERTFSGLKACALNTLHIQAEAIKRGMTLKDASAYNMQFSNGRWLLIDTGSFETWQDGTPWVAYGQFCRHFLAPLLLMACGDLRLLSLLRQFTDGVPLDMAAKMLPLRTRLKPGAFMHVTLHGRYTAQGGTGKAQNVQVGKNALLGLVDSLKALIESLNVAKHKTAWTDYETEHTYDSAEYAAKEKWISAAVQDMQPKSIWDFGANTGHFSRLAAAAAPCAAVTAFEYDAMTAEAGAHASTVAGGNMPLHLWMDLLNPTPGGGWAGCEWPGIVERGPADLVLALALLHHLCLAGNITLPMAASFMARTARHLVVEFVPKADPQAQRLLASKPDIYLGYTQENFEQAFAVHFDTLRSDMVSKTGRMLYLMRKKT